MKRTLDGHAKVVKWEYCFICQRCDQNDLRRTDTGSDKLAERLKTYWDLGGEFDFDVQQIAIFENGDPDFKTSFTENGAKYHHNCASRYSTQKIGRLRDKKKKESTNTARRSSHEKRKFASYFCAICQKEDDPDNLHAAGSWHATNKDVNRQHNEEFTEKWKDMALKVGNDFLISLLSRGDLKSNEIYYHSICYKDMKRECDRLDKSTDTAENMKWLEAEVLDEVIRHVIETEHLVPGSVFVVHELNVMYVEKLEQFDILKKVNTTNFKDKLLKQVPNLKTDTVKGRTVVLFEQTVSGIVSDYASNPDDFFSALRKVIDPIRQEIFNQKNEFRGHLNGASQVDAVPKRLLFLVRALINGDNSSTNHFDQDTLTCSQLILANCHKVRKNRVPDKVVQHRHSKSRETPVMLYVSLKIYSLCRSSDLITHLFHLGICVSYDRILEICKRIYENLRESFLNYNCYFPNILKKELFTIMCKDNIDVNASANFIKAHYHGTSISIIQFKTRENSGKDFPEVDISAPVSAKSKKLSPLPSEYINVRDMFPSQPKSSRLWAPVCTVHFQDITEFIDSNVAKFDEIAWLELVVKVVGNSNSNASDLAPGWAQHHASQKRSVVQPPGVNTISPLLRDKVSTLKMQTHCMLLNINSTKVLNPQQTPIDVSDQPVYALTKEAQYRFPSVFLEYVPLLGGLHIEQSLLSLHSEMIKGSGLLEILNQPNLSTIGVSAVVDVNSINRARYCVQVTMSALYRKLKDACEIDGTTLPPYEWLSLKSKKSKSLFFWKMVLDFQLDILIFVRSMREGDFKLYVEILRKLIKWYFIFDKVHYSRWLSVHIFDLMTMEIKFPDVYENMVSGCFSFQKSAREFSRMALDQVHEQNNRTLKAFGGAVNFMNRSDDSALIRWETCGPDIARLVNEFEDGMDNVVFNDSETRRHHEDNKSFQEAFTNDVRTLYAGIPSNPFESDELTKLNDPTAFIPEILYTKIAEMEKIGEEQFVRYLNDRLLYQRVSICETIPQNNFCIWDFEKHEPEKPFLPNHSTANKMRSACEYRAEKAKEVFGHEIFGVAQSLSRSSQSMYHGSKSDVCKRLVPFRKQQVPPTESKSVIIIEMSPVIRAKCTSIVDEYSFSDLSVLLYHHIMFLGREYDRIDLVFDRYFEKSLKNDTRKGRGGNGTRFHFTDDTPLPNNMVDDFLKNSQNKDDLGRYLAEKFMEVHNSPKLLIATFENTVLCSSDVDEIQNEQFSIIHCQSEEADQRLVRHALQCLTSSTYSRIIVRTIDTDVLILLISFLGTFLNLSSDAEIFAELINTSVFYNINEIVSSLGKDVCAALRFFYAFTGCDTVSSFYGKGKVKAWDTWFKSTKKDDFTATFKSLGNRASSIDEAEMSLLEEFVISLYGGKTNSSSGTDINQMRLNKFKLLSDNDIRKLPPSKGALFQHASRSCYTSGFLWYEALQDFDLPCPSKFAYVFYPEQRIFIPVWELSKSMVDIPTFVSTCSCSTKKCQNCKCAKANAPANAQCLTMCLCLRECKGRR